MNYFKYGLLCLSLLCSSLCAASPANQNFIAYFNTKTAHQNLLRLNKQFLAPNIEASRLKNNVKQLDTIQDQAEECVDRAATEVKSLDALLSTIEAKHLVNTQKGDYQYLQDKKIFYTKQLYECRLYVYRSKEAIINYKNKIQNLSTDKIMQRSTPIWTLAHSIRVAPSSQFKVAHFLHSSGIHAISSNLLILWGILIAIGFVVVFYIRYLCRRWTKKHVTSGSPILAFVSVVSSMLMPIMLLGVSSLVLEAAYSNQATNPLLETFVDDAFIFILVITLIKYLFFPARSIENPFGLKPKLSKALYIRLSTIVTWLLLGSLLKSILQNQSLDMGLMQLSETIFISIFIILMSWVLWPFFKLPLLQRINKGVLMLVKIIITLLLLSMLIIEWLGFTNLALYLLTASSLSLGLILVAMGVWSLIHKAYQLVDNTQHLFAKKIHTFFGIKFHKKIPELILLKFVCYLLILIVAVVYLMRIWGVSANAVDSLKEHLISGFEFSGFTIQPLHIVIAIVIFVLLLLCGRFLATLTAKRYNLGREADTQIAIASLIVYVSFAIALIIALVIMGVNFTGLAIIAGALSVGIGLGLQTIVNNFVSGIILLIEKPIKPGDRVVVGSTEGFVKRIRLRSTQIATLAKEDVIIPNSDLITNQVTNYMFRDKQWRITCQVGVAYGSDIELVKKVLLDVASKNDSVIQNAPNDPLVLFRSFGDSSLLFELWCVIDDVNKKYKVVSDLNFAIDKAFRDNQITIAFPQRDVHIKQ